MFIDITRPLCRGRIISLGPNDDRFISFKYERLPNICYWCGLVSHDDKECSLWLSSKGSLKVDNQNSVPGSGLHKSIQLENLLWRSKVLIKLKFNTILGSQAQHGRVLHLYKNVICL